MARNIEEFLKRAAERRKQQQQNQPPPAQPPRQTRRVVEPAEIEIVEPVQVVKPLKAKSKQPRKSLAKERPTLKRDLRDQSVADHVRQHIDTRDVSQHAEHLGERIQHVDDEVSARIHRIFDHDVGQLDDMPTVQDDEVATVTDMQYSKLANDLLNMLSNPESVRQAIMVSEILRRPNFDD